jgi:hypothetical protein
MREPLPMCKADGCQNRCKRTHTRRKRSHGWTRVITQYCCRECSDVAVGVVRAERNRLARYRKALDRLGPRFNRGDLVMVIDEIVKRERNSAYATGRRRGLKLAQKLAA